MLLDLNDEGCLRNVLAAFLTAEREQRDLDVHPDHLLKYMITDDREKRTAFLRYIAKTSPCPDLLEVVNRLGDVETMRIITQWVAETRTPRSHEYLQDIAFGESWANGLWRLKMPPEVLLLAIEQANGEHQFSGPGACERHPAVLTLANWWNANIPAGEPRAGCGTIFVRPRSSADWLQDAATQGRPSIDIDEWLELRSATAFVAPATFIVFIEPQEVSRSRPLEQPGDWLARRTVAGDFFDSTDPYDHDYQNGDFDTASESLDALQLYPTMFPAAYAALNTSDPIQSSFGKDPWDIIAEF